MAKRVGLVVVALVVLVGGGWLGWRLLARRRSLPCPTWLAWLLENPFTRVDARGQRLLDGLGIAPGMRVLDAGCGPGRLTVPAAERVGPAGAVVALDIQPGMLDRLRARLSARGLTNVQPLLGGLGQGRLPRDSFDRAMLVTVLGEIPDRVAALREVRAALKPGGVLAVGELALDPHYQPAATVRRLAEAAGLQVADQTGSWFAYTLHLRRPVVDEPSGGVGQAEGGAGAPGTGTGQPR